VQRFHFSLLVYSFLYSSILLPLLVFLCLLLHIIMSLLSPVSARGFFYHGEWALTFSHSYYFVLHLSTYKSFITLSFFSLLPLCACILDVFQRVATASVRMSASKQH